MKQQQQIRFDSPVAEIQLVYKSKVSPDKRRKITAIQEAVNTFREYWNTDTIDLQEEMKVLYLNRACHLLGIYHLSTGSMNATVVDIRLILIAALRLGAQQIILCHSHPSGNLLPSKEDKQITEKIKAAATLLDMSLLDHIIMTREGSYSFAEAGLL